MTFDYMVEIVTGINDGKEIQLKGIDGKWCEWKNPKLVRKWIDLEDNEIRFKPKLVKRLLRGNELPMPCVLKNGSGRWQVIEIQGDKIRTSVCWSTITDLAKGGTFWAGPPDFNNFHNFEIEEETV